MYYGFLYSHDWLGPKTWNIFVSLFDLMQDKKSIGIIRENENRRFSIWKYNNYINEWYSDDDDLEILLYVKNMNKIF
jgi:hypothetical protein